MRIIAILAAAAVLAGCSTTSEPTRNANRPLTNRAGVKLPPGTPPIGSLMSTTPMVGANVEDTRRPGVLYCATCGSPTDKTGACPCNQMGMPGFGIAPTGRVRRSTSPR